MSKYPHSPELQNRVAQLSSLLETLYGDGFEHFESLCARDRENILWLASDLANAIDAEINGSGVSHD